MPAKAKPTKKAEKKAKPKAASKQPVTTPLVTKITKQIDNQEITDRKGKGFKAIGPDRMRLMQADVMSAVVNKFNGDTLADMLWDLTNAETITNGGTIIPDNRIRLQALALAFAYTIGKPVEKQEILNINMDADSAHNLAERLKGSPALRAAFRSILEQAEGGETTEALPAPVKMEKIKPMKQAKKAAIRKPAKLLEFED